MKNLEEGGDLVGRLVAALEVGAKAALKMPSGKKKAAIEARTAVVDLEIILASDEALDERTRVLGGLPKYLAIRELEA